MGWLYFQSCDISLENTPTTCSWSTPSYVRMQWFCNTSFVMRLLMQCVWLHYISTSSCTLLLPWCFFLNIAACCPVVTAQWQTTGCSSLLSWVRFLANASLFTDLSMKSLGKWRCLSGWTAAVHSPSVQSKDFLVNLSFMDVCVSWVFMVRGDLTKPGC